MPAKKPTALQVLSGQDRAHPERVNRQEPVPTDRPIEPPWPLTDEARREWDDMAPDLIAKGVLTAWDTRSFALFCEALVAAKDAVPDMYLPAQAGAPAPMARFKTAVDLCATLGGRFGWTPVDRSRLIVGGQQENPKGRLLG